MNTQCLQQAQRLQAPVAWSLGRREVILNSLSVPFLTETQGKPQSIDAEHIWFGGWTLGMLGVPFL